MVEIADVNDRESLQAYLETLEGDAGLLTTRRAGFRAAARVLPLALQYFLGEDAAKRDVTAVPIFGALAIGGVMAVRPSPPIDTDAANAAAAAVGGAYMTIASRADDAVAYAAANAADVVAAAAGYSVVDAATRRASYAVYYAADAVTQAAADTAEFWDWVRADLDYSSGDSGYSVHGIWQGLGEPEYLRRLWKSAKQKMEADSLDWSFWIRWYERVREGRDFHADKLAEILNPLREEDWKQGPAHINPKFADLLALYREDDERDGAVGEPLAPRRPANIKAIRSQIVALKDYVDGEFEFLRGQNQVSAVDGVDRDAMLEVLEALREIVDDILSTFDEDGDTSRALTHVEEKLPAVVEKAAELAELETQPNVSGPIIAMTANVKYLTDNGWPGHLAAGVAASELGWQYLKSGWRFVAPKGSKEPTALTRFPPKGDDQ